MFPPLAASNQTILSPAFAVAVAVSVCGVPSSQTSWSPPVVGISGVASIVKVTGVQVALTHPVTSSTASAQ